MPVIHILAASGSGKTTLGLKLKEHSNKFAVIELDDIDDFNRDRLGRSWCYDKDWLYDPSFHSSVGFEKSEKNWYIITAIFKKEDIDIDDTLQMLIVNTGEREIRVINYDTKPIKYKIDKYDKNI